MKKNNVIVNYMVKKKISVFSKLDKNDNYFISWYRFVLQIFACCVAYTCNKRSKKNNPYVVLVVAFLFPEVYILQVVFRRYILNDYKC